ncbi:hypothetical protein Tsubulata_046322 [Turnera subulata]|uniref:Uncharacterized protein n=1 Tax=Turnera subulata TaxID=218843 RepID=A0A9Q0FYI9_9ROSI|nr:hypothetical protein Tsubulata_046322 [Turnera subulata]
MEFRSKSGIGSGVIPGDGSDSDDGDVEGGNGGPVWIVLAVEPQLLLQAVDFGGRGDEDGDGDGGGCTNVKPDPVLRQKWVEEIWLRNKTSKFDCINDQMPIVKGIKTTSWNLGIPLVNVSG